MAMATSKPIASSSFYGENRSQLIESNEPLPAAEPVLPPYLSDPLLGPSKVWKIFRKQAEALSLISSLGLSGHLLPFSYESINQERLFLAAHPDVFWFRDCQKRPHLRNTYEIIASDAVSKLYFDLEFERPLNKDADGNEMTRTLIRVVLYYIHKLFHVKYKMKDVLILDSSTEKKFSAHLVFQTPLVFRTNIDAGHFVKYVCGEMGNIDLVCSDEEQLKFDIFKETTINIYAIKDLFVVNSKQTRVLFVDLGVYTKNRLFRLYRSTKQGRQSPLLLSGINKFQPPNPSPDPIQLDRQIFLSSLITFFTAPPTEELIKEFEKPLLNPLYSTEVNLRRLEKLHSGQLSPTKTSPYPALDDYIRTRVKPHGSIYRNVHFPSTNITVYDIKGYRYCGNIGRWHRSQNIKLIADVNRGVYYQKCHDVECAEYKSQEWGLPPEVLFKIREDEGDSLFEAVELEELLSETPGIEEGKKIETPGMQEGKKIEMPGIEEGKKIETPGIEEGKKIETPGIEEGKKIETPGIEEGKKIEMSGIEERNVKVETSGIQEEKYVQTTGIEESKKIEMSGIEERNVKVETPGIQEEKKIETPRMEEGKLKVETLGMQEGKVKVELSCTQGKVTGKQELREGKLLSESPGERCMRVKERLSEPSSIEEKLKSELSERVSEVPCIKEELKDDLSERLNGPSCKVEVMESLNESDRKEIDSELGKPQKESHSEHCIENFEEVNNRTRVGKSKETFNETYSIVKEESNNEQSTEKIKDSTHAKGIRKIREPNNEHSSGKFKKPINDETHSIREENLIALSKKKLPDSNTHANNLSSSNQSETKILLDTIENVSDKEMVLEYVRNQERKLNRNNSERNSKETFETTTPCEPVVKKIKF